VAAPLDPTGCGDVFGATVVSFLAQGAAVADAVQTANRNAASNLKHRGATHLHRHLKGQLLVE
jgi:sugar/nucleoside kinase (ribokinase family)